MANKNLNLKFHWDNKWLVTAVKGIQTSLRNAEKATQSFYAEMKKMATVVGQTAGEMKTSTASTKKMEENIEDLGQQAAITAQKIDKMNKSMKVTSSNSFWSAMSKGFKTMWNDIIRTTKLLATFATVAWGIQFHRAKEEYLNYSAQLMQLRNVTDSWSSEFVQNRLKEQVNKQALRSGVNSATFMNDVQAAVSWSMPLNLAWKSDTEAAKVIDENMAAYWKIGLFAKAHWGTVEQTAELATRYWASIGFKPEEMAANMDRILGMISVIMDESAGTLHEISTSLSRPMLRGMAGWGDNELITAALFSIATRTKNPMLAGRHIWALMDSLNNAIVEAPRVSTKLTNLLKPKKWTEWEVREFWAWTEWETEAAREYLKWFDSPKEIGQKLFQTLDDDWKWRKATPLEILGNYQKAMDWAEALWMEQSSFLQLIQWKSEVRDSILGLIANDASWLAALNDTLNNFWTEADRTKKLNQKEENVTNNFAHKYWQVLSAYSTYMNKAFDKMSPSMNALTDTIVNMFEGKSTDMKTMNDIFKANADELRDTNPMLATMVDLMRQFTWYAESWELVENLKDIGNTIMFIVDWTKAMIAWFSAVYNSAPVKWLRDLFWGWAWANFLVAVWGMSLAKQFAWAFVWMKLGTSLWALIGWWFSKTAWKWVGKGIWLAMKALDWAPIWLAIWVAIWNQIVKYWDKEFNKINFKWTQSSIEDWTAIVKFQSLNKTQRDILARMMSKAYANTAIGRWADAYLKWYTSLNGKYSPDLMAARERMKLIEWTFKKGLPMNDLKAMFPDEALAFANAERSQISTTDLWSMADRVTWGKDLADSNNANALIQNLNHVSQINVENLKDNTKSLQALTDTLLNNYQSLPQPIWAKWNNDTSSWWTPIWVTAAQN